MVITVHRWLANKSCPGNWLYNKLGDLAAEVTSTLDYSTQASSASTSTTYRVRKTWSDGISQKGYIKCLQMQRRVLIRTLDIIFLM